MHQFTRTYAISINDVVGDRLRKFWADVCETTLLGKERSRVVAHCCALASLMDLFFEREQFSFIGSRVR
jgi:hypothetical protein